MHRPIERPSGGSAQWVTRQGCRVSRPRPGMADGGGPTEQDRSEGMPSLSEAPNERVEALWLLSRSSKVTRRKGGTNSSRYRITDIHPMHGVSRRTTKLDDKTPKSSPQHPVNQRLAAPHPAQNVRGRNPNKPSLSRRTAIFQIDSPAPKSI